MNEISGIVAITRRVVTYVGCPGTEGARENTRQARLLQVVINSGDFLYN